MKSVTIASTICSSSRVNRYRRSGPSAVIEAMARRQFEFLKRYDKMPVKKIKEIAFEIGMSVATALITRRAIRNTL